MNNGRLLIADLGISKQLTEAVGTSSNSEILGMPAYIDPQCYIKETYKRNKKSDIYSLGVLLWEITSGRAPFPNIKRHFISYRIREGLRETPVVGTPSKYQQLYQECWNVDPDSRPDIDKIHDTLTQLKLQIDTEIQAQQLQGSSTTRVGKKPLILSSLRCFALVLTCYHVN